MKRSVLNTVKFKSILALAFTSVLSAGVFAQVVSIVPAGTVAKPNLVPVDNSVSFSINPIAFGTCYNNLSYSWAIVDSKKDTIYRSTSASPRFNFTKEGIYTVALTVKTVPGGYCTANVTRSGTSVVRVSKIGAGGAPKPNMFSANALGTMISAYTVNDKGEILAGPYDYFDPFPADNAITAALSMDDKGNFFYLPTFMNGTTQVKKAGVVEVWAVDKNANNAPVVIASFDMNGASTTELGLFRMGLDKDGNAWILAGDGANMYATTFKTNGTKVIKQTDVKIHTVPFTSGSAADFESGDLAFDNKGNMYVLAGSSTGTNIYTMATNTATPTLSKKWKVTNTAGANFGLAVTGTVFDSQGNMFFSALDGIYYIDYNGVNAATATAIVKKISENFGLMDLATSQFPAAWTPPFDGGGAVLPVKLNRFAGTATADKVVLNWGVSSNETGHHFELEKSLNGTAFNMVALVFNTEKEGDEAYNYTDHAPVADRVFYRLKMVNKNKSVSYSNVVSFKSQSRQAKLALAQNPVTSSLNFNYTTAENTVAEITVYTFAGVKVFTQKHNLQKGNNSINIPVSNMLTKGMYLLDVKEGANSQSVKFLKQ